MTVRPLKHENTEEQIKHLQRAIDEHTRKLETVKQEKCRAEEDVAQCARETEQRVLMMKETSEVVDVLQELNHLLQEEKQLSEELKGQISAHRDQRTNLQENDECVTNKAKRLAAQTLEVKQTLAEARARYVAAQALIRAPASKSKRNQSKPK